MVKMEFIIKTLKSLCHFKEIISLYKYINNCIKY